MTLQAECRKAILDTLKKEGMPPIIDKTYNSIWEAFMKTQPHILSGAGAGKLVNYKINLNLKNKRKSIFAFFFVVHRFPRAVGRRERLWES